MKKFSPKKIDISSINGGNEYQNGDALSAETINALINDAAYEQENKGSLYYHTLKFSNSQNNDVGYITFISPYSQAYTFSTIKEWLAKYNTNNMMAIGCNGYINATAVKISNVVSLFKNSSGYLACRGYILEGTFIDYTIEDYYNILSDHVIEVKL